MVREREGCNQGSLICYMLQKKTLISHLELSKLVIQLIKELVNSSSSNKSKLSYLILDQCSRTSNNSKTCNTTWTAWTTCTATKIWAKTWASQWEPKCNLLLLNFTMLTSSRSSNSNNSNRWWVTMDLWITSPGFSDEQNKKSHAQYKKQFLQKF